MRNENFFSIQGWMINKLKFNNMNELAIYAIIYGFSQDGNSKFTGTIKYLMECTLIKSNKTVSDILKNLVLANLIIKEEIIINNCKFNHYKVNLSIIDTPVKNTDTPSNNYIDPMQKIPNPPVKNTDNNKDIYNKENINNNINNSSCKKSDSEEVLNFFEQKLGRAFDKKTAVFKSRINLIEKALKHYSKDDLKNLIEFKFTNKFTQKINLCSWFNREYLHDNIEKMNMWLENNKQHIYNTQSNNNKTLNTNQIIKNCNDVYRGDVNDF